LVLLSLLLGACGGDGAADDGATVVVSTSILADVVSEILGDSATVVTIIPAGTDPHEFQLSSAAAAQIGSADLVVLNGLGLDSAVAEVAASAEADGVPVLEVAPLVDPLPFAGEAHADEEDGDHAEDEEGLDPHFWHDPWRMAAAVERIAAAVIEHIDGIDAEAVEASAGDYTAEMLAVDEDLAAAFFSVPAEQRVMVTNHDALGYLADRYDIKVLGVVIPGGELGEPSSAELKELVDALRSSQVRAIFADAVNSTALAEAVAAELGDQVEVISLYTDSLDPDGGTAATYLGMLRYNGEAVLDTMR
jgi:zinc/manganese transport system substrate-binding protein